ncbi:GTP-binding protein 8-like isoform X1 [Paramacrobiotus metropolitanus]|uniref:GTP-binding protein 8-like isoform X1 n=1 Tax=Paramacrobiotus metropolitanus TaxID=2943436 RepID=UPI00244608CE|nr:GTP-binding protein 8-like isoform X1 [Paramacrobiotus metropolitanus]XP_055335111.1 GTP-binding protein 8-like isoform X1 [Paramacrobiotus metropolitanus]
MQRQCCHCIRTVASYAQALAASSTVVSPARKFLQLLCTQSYATISFTDPSVQDRRKNRSFVPQDPDFLFVDPTAALQKYVEAPLFNVNEKPFTPTKLDMLAAQEVFRSTTEGDIKMIDSMIDPDEAPLYDLPEIAFLGQSNVGKSSLIRALFINTPRLKVPISKTPGYTKTLRFYQVKDHFTLVDMPGYGFGQPEYFRTCVEGFLRKRKNLRFVFLLVDGSSHTWNERDLRMLQYLEVLRVYFCVVLNKIDLANDTARLKKLAMVRQVRDQYASPSCFPQPFFVSSLTGEGLAYIQAFIAHITGALALESDR